jgi:hypothetical protein
MSVEVDPTWKVTERHMAAAQHLFPKYTVGELMYEAANIAKHVPDYTEAVRKLRASFKEACALIGQWRDMEAREVLRSALEETKEFDQ